MVNEQFFFKRKKFEINNDKWNWINVIVSFDWAGEQ